MKALQERDLHAEIEVHKSTPARVYETDRLQADRIERSRNAIAEIIGDRTDRLRITELGCGTADISGPFSTRHSVIGIDINEAALKIARERFPQMQVFNRPLEKALIWTDILVVCEVLEHLSDPISVVMNWLPLAKNVVISHPFNEPTGSELSGGEHQWSFDESDFRNWFDIGGHNLVGEPTIYPMGLYHMILGRGEHK